MGAQSGVFSWPYIAGFLDGDGSIEIDQRTSGCCVVRLKWFQATKNKEVLTCINQFFKWNDPWVNSKIAKQNDRQTQLSIYSKEHVEYTLKKLFPYLIVKAPKAKRALDLMGCNEPIKAKPVDWDYLAGFFDADGHIATSNQRGYRQYCIGWTQSESNSFVLDEIKEFLNLRNIYVSESIIDPTKYKNGLNKGKGNLARQIRPSQGFTKWMLQKMYPFLIVKHEKASEAIKYLTEVETMKEKYGWNYRKAIALEGGI